MRNVTDCRPNTPAAPGVRAALPPAGALLTAALWLWGVSSALAAGTFYVDGADPNCVNSGAGAGSSTTPYCTITAADKARRGPGTTIYVKPAVYRERIDVTGSGAAGSPYVFQALGSPVLLDGADDFSSPDLWAPYSGNVWLAASVTWTPLQVFADGARLTPSSASPDLLPPGTFRYLAGLGLAVNVGGDNPASHQALVGRRANGFYISGRSWVTVDGFMVTRTNDNGIYVRNSSNHATITNNTVSFTNGYGIAGSRILDSLFASNIVSDANSHGIGVTNISARVTLQDNESFRNSDPAARRANGIYVHGSSDILIQRNRLHHNQDTGLQINRDTNCIALQNLSWSNGDHGFDQTFSTGTLHVGNVAWGNFLEGFSVEGEATGTQIFNSIAINNGEWNLFVDIGSMPGFVSNYNIFWNADGRSPVRVNNITYHTLAAYAAATGLDAQSIQADPLFADPANGDFHLRRGSPAIDSADSSVASWPATDAEGNARADDPAAADTGAGPVVFADRGALEFVNVGNPIATLAITPSSGTGPLPVTADASGSIDFDGTIVSYRFDFGDGTVVGPQAGATAGHTYASGTWTATVTVTDNDDKTASATATVAVGAPNDPPAAALTVTPSSGTEPLAVTADASGSSDSDGTIVSYRFDFGDGTVVGPQAGATAGHTYAVGTWTATVTVTDNAGATRSASAGVTVANNPDLNRVGNPSFEIDTAGWGVYSGSTIQRVAGGHDGSFSLQMTAPAGSTAGFGTNDTPNWIGKTPAAGAVYRFTAWVRADTSTGHGRLRVREYLNGVQVGAASLSALVTLSPSWQLLTVDHVVGAAGSNLDFQVLDFPVTTGEVFQTDDIAIRLISIP